MKRINAFHEETEKPAIKKKPNIVGLIHKGNVNYIHKDLEGLDPIIPFEDAEVTMIKQNRIPTTKVPDRLPTAGLPFYPIDEHRAIGQFETNHNLYLVFAHAYNKLMEKIEQLELEIKQLKGL